jgi:hypothetical protein
MFAIRYATLAMLVIWIGGLMFLLNGALTDQMRRRFDPLAYGCGVLMLLGLFVMKFVGPPPAAFTVRVVLVVLMLAATFVAAALRTPTAGAAFNAAVGLALLAWYARE